MAKAQKKKNKGPRVFHFEISNISAAKKVGQCLKLFDFLAKNDDNRRDWGIVENLCTIGHSSFSDAEFPELWRHWEKFKFFEFG